MLVRVVEKLKYRKVRRTNYKFLSLRTGTLLQFGKPLAWGPRISSSTSPRPTRFPYSQLGWAQPTPKPAVF